MFLFIVNAEKPFNGPHQNQTYVTGGADIISADITMILMDSRGASAESMLMSVREFERQDIHYRALQAKGHTWHPRSFLALNEMNEPGISSGLQAIYDQITELNEAEISTEKIVLLDFSQGACLTVEFAACHPQHFGGIVG